MQTARWNHAYEKYWTDESCRRPEVASHFDEALREAQFCAARADDRFADPTDTLMKEYFRRIFVVNGLQTYVNENIGDIIGSLRAMASWKQEQDQNKALYKFFCDDDHVEQSSNTKARWKLRTDPPGSLPVSYWQQTARFPRNVYESQSMPEEVDDQEDDDEAYYPEYEDQVNKYMGKSGGCQHSGEPKPQAALFQAIQKTDRPATGITILFTL
ncbi:MAG: hypothetical protein Q9227_007001, partial [Pyrenula ochraceoflavens]